MSHYEQGQSIVEDKLEWFPEYVIELETGRRYALACDWFPGITDNDIPASLRVEPGHDAWLKRWEGVTPTDQRTGRLTTDLERRLQAEREQRVSIRKAKNRRGLDKIKRDHPNERYDRKLKKWVPKNG